MSLGWATAIVLVASAGSVAILLAIRRWSPHGGHFGDTSRAAGVFSILATSFAVLFAFVVFLAFGSYDKAGSGAETEAQTVVQQLETAQLLPAAAAPRLTAELTCYARSVVHQEWPAMARGETPDLNAWGAPLFFTLEDVDPQTPVEQAAFAKWLDQTSEREQARQDRILGEEGAIPAPVWFVLLISAGIVWGFVFLFADRGEGRFVQAAMVGAVTAMIVSGLLVVRFLDYPYSHGSGSLRPTAMEQSLKQMDEATHILNLDLPTLCDESGQRLSGAAGG